MVLSNWQEATRDYDYDGITLERDVTTDPGSLNSSIDLYEVDTPLHFGSRDITKIGIDFIEGERLKVWALYRDGDVHANWRTPQDDRLSRHGQFIDKQDRRGDDVPDNLEGAIAMTQEAIMEAVDND